MSAIPKGCYCKEMDPRVIEGGGKCETCHAADENYSAEQRAWLAKNPRMAELGRRAIAGDRTVWAAVKAYGSDAELEAAETLAGIQDYTDGGSPVDAAGRRV